MVVPHKFGESVVSEEPERVVVVGLTEQDTLLQLGVVPIAVTEWFGEKPFATWPWAEELLRDAESDVLSASDGFELERIAALEPDLIVGTNAGLTQKGYDLLSQIAPTIPSVEGSTRYFSSCSRGQLSRSARALAARRTGRRWSMTSRRSTPRYPGPPAGRCPRERQLEDDLQVGARRRPDGHRARPLEGNILAHLKRGTSHRERRAPCRDRRPR